MKNAAVTAIATGKLPTVITLDASVGDSIHRYRHRAHLHQHYVYTAICLS
jgi:hypothetical protein